MILLRRQHWSGLANGGTCPYTDHKGLVRHSLLLKRSTRWAGSARDILENFNRIAHTWGIMPLRMLGYLEIASFWWWWQWVFPLSLSHPSLQPVVPHRPPHLPGVAIWGEIWSSPTTPAPRPCARKGNCFEKKGNPCLTVSCQSRCPFALPPPTPY